MPQSRVPNISSSLRSAGDALPDGVPFAQEPRLLDRRRRQPDLHRAVRAEHRLRRGEAGLRGGELLAGSRSSLPVYFLGLWMRTIRWQYLLRPVKKVTTLRLYPVVIIGLMANNLLPARAGELARAYVLGERENISKTAASRHDRGRPPVRWRDARPAAAHRRRVRRRRHDFPGGLRQELNFAGLGIVMAVLFGIALAVLFYLALSTDRAPAAAPTRAPLRAGHASSPTSRACWTRSSRACRRSAARSTSRSPG